MIIYTEKGSASAVRIECNADCFQGGITTIEIEYCEGYRVSDEKQDPPLAGGVDVFS